MEKESAAKLLFVQHGTAASGELRNERVSDRESAVDHLARLQVFGIERGAVSFECRRDDERVINVVAAAHGEQNAASCVSAVIGIGDGHKILMAPSASVTSCHDMPGFRCATAAACSTLGR